ncbi:FKBP-type peptidyl-prolyl cis-trans isomerase [Actinomadura parmotrematis]|uniref:peptidylprolyl isomerase n=1 Tax=Actinomadura parmotrematis TaxID=2864039 RepID=A0ABS7G144_9ACTN|nr:FKBP-type peptidyl-prolyl cis-trans isomerase [Actinomadura parmotrematis]MBW8486434.1 FKBP-type peptidyl-prolyl cis-trans isomerase [Actinomadura parmotrematis]
MSEDDKPRSEPAVKAKLPSAKNIRSPEFKPHGISGGGRSSGVVGGGGSRPSGLTAAQARKRRRIGIAAAVVVVLAVAGGTTWYFTRPGPEVTVSGAFGKDAKAKIPKELKPAAKLKVSTPIKGTGNKIASGDTVFAKYTFYQWAKKGDHESTNKMITSSYKEAVRPLVIGKSGVKGVDTGLVGQTAGSRVVLEIPPAQGFGEQAEQVGLGAKDSVVFILDVLSSIPKNAGPTGTEQKLTDKNLPSVVAGKQGEAPKITIPKADAPDKLVAKTLVAGTGQALAKGDSAIVQYQGQIWKTGKVFDSSWASGNGPTQFPIGTGETVPGFDKGLTGQKVGSRVLLVLPPKEGYGTKGNEQAGIKGTDTLVFVVDILGITPK